MAALCEPPQSSPSALAPSHGVDCSLYDVVVPLHTFRADQRLIGDRIVKAIAPKGDVVPIRPPHDETPMHLQGLVHTRRVAQAPHRAEEHREVCSTDLFDAVLSLGGALTGGDLMQGCGVQRLKLHGRCAHGPCRARPLMRAPPPRRLSWFAQMATTVAHAHAHGLLHGQLCPEHVLLGGASGEEVKLLGFDPLIWRQVRFGASIGEQHALRRPGVHDAPELAGRTHASVSELAAADVWSLGVMLTAILAEEPPQCVHSEGVRLPAAIDAAPLGVRHLLNAMLNVTPSERPSSSAVQAHAEALLRTRGEQGTTAPAMLASPASSGTSTSGLSLSLAARDVSAITMDRTESTLSTFSDDLSEAPTRASSLMALEETGPKRPVPSKSELLYEQLRQLEGRPLLTSQSMGTETSS